MVAHPDPPKPKDHWLFRRTMAFLAFFQAVLRLWYCSHYGKELLDGELIFYTILIGQWAFPAFLEDMYKHKLGKL